VGGGEKEILSLNPIFMVKKYILPFIIFLCGLGLIMPTMSLAAYNDVQFDADTEVYLEGVPTTLIVASGGTAASMTVYPSSVAFGMENLSSVTISNADKRTLTNTMDATVTCGASASSVTLTSSSTQIVTVTIGTSCEPSGGSGAVSSYTPPPTPEPDPEPEDYTVEADCEEAGYYWYDSVCNATEEVVVPTETASAEATATAAAGGEASATTDQGAEVSIDVPADAVTADTTVSITPTATTAAAVSTAVGSVPTGQSLVGGYVYNYSAASEGVAVTTFSQAVSLTMTYTDTQIEGLDESTLSIHYWNETTQAWVALTTTVDQANNTLTATTDHLTYFGIMGEEAEEEVEEEAPVEEPEEETTAEIIARLKARIVEILALIAQVQARLAVLRGETVAGVPAGFTFKTSLVLGMSSNDVKYLQIVLNRSPDTQIASSGVGSPGNETNYFGSLTKQAVIKFQNKYAEDVLVPWGFSAGTGYVGSTTQEKLNSLLGE